MKNSKTTLLKGLLVAGAMMTTGVITVSASSLVNFKNLGEGAEVRCNLSGNEYAKTGVEMNCGANAAATTDKTATDMKCGEGKCGDAKSDTTAKDSKSTEMKCGEGKCGDVKPADSKTTDMKCGEGKCGDAKPADTKSTKTSGKK
jgi:uncharacterized low-complexity protein